MSDTLRITLAQLNPTVGDFAANAAKAREAHEAAAAAGSQLVVLPEMFLTGYQTSDLGRKPAFVAEAYRWVERLAAECAEGPALGIGAPLREGEALFNAYFILHRGVVQTVVRKQILPNDDVFDEVRVYAPGPPAGPFVLDGIRLGTPSCADAWHPGPTETFEESGAEILVVPNGSPYHRDKQDVRMSLMVARVIESGLPLIYLNTIGGQDDQVFDGGSFVLNPGGGLAMSMPVFEEALEHVTFERLNGQFVCQDGPRAEWPDALAQVYAALVYGLRDYLGKSGFNKVLLGLSGGVDSALVAAIAADAIGSENVRCVMLPSEYTSAHSLEDAEAVAKALGCPYQSVPISGARAAVTEALAPAFVGRGPDVTEENIQSRLRGLILMAMSNKFGEMLLTTGNKSEVAVGYATIYGDMSGGYNPLKDLYKTRVFETCRWRNAQHRDWMKGPEGIVIPTRVIDKPPSAELREDQKDEDSLPPYEVLDAILDMLIEQDASVEEIVAKGYDRDTVSRVEHLIYISEYKRFQSAPGPRLTAKAFWLDRRYPIVNRWRDARSA